MWGSFETTVDLQGGKWWSAPLTVKPSAPVETLCAAVCKSGYYWCVIREVSCLILADSDIPSFISFLQDVCSLFLIRSVLLWWKSVSRWGKSRERLFFIITQVTPFPNFQDTYGFQLFETPWLSPAASLRQLHAGIFPLDQPIAACSCLRVMALSGLGDVTLLFLLKKYKKNLIRPGIKRWKWSYMLTL